MITAGNGTFQTTVVNAGPQSVALSAPQNAGGTFELDLQPEILLPFEGIGVDTVWRLELPRAANPFDYGTIADVLLTIEYTALASPDYRAQVIAGSAANARAPTGRSACASSSPMPGTTCTTRTRPRAR